MHLSQKALSVNLVLRPASLPQCHIVRGHRLHTGCSDMTLWALCGRACSTSHSLVGLAYAGSQQGGRLTGPYDRGPAADMDLFLYKTVEVDCLVANSRTGGIRCQVMSS